jgi:hypothetical protein
MTSIQESCTIYSSKKYIMFLLVFTLLFCWLHAILVGSNISLAEPSSFISKLRDRIRQKKPLVKRRKILMKERKYQKRESNRSKYEQLKAAGIRCRKDDELRLEEKSKYRTAIIPQVTPPKL